MCYIDNKFLDLLILPVLSYPSTLTWPSWHLVSYCLLDHWDEDSSWRRSKHIHSSCPVDSAGLAEFQMLSSNQSGAWCIFCRRFLSNSEPEKFNYLNANSTLPLPLTFPIICLSLCGISISPIVCWLMLYRVMPYSRR